MEQSPKSSLLFVRIGFVFLVNIFFGLLLEADDHRVSEIRTVRALCPDLGPAWDFSKREGDLPFEKLEKKLEKWEYASSVVGVDADRVLVTFPRDPGNINGDGESKIVLYKIVADKDGNISDVIQLDSEITTRGKLGKLGKLLDENVLKRDCPSCVPTGPEFFKELHKAGFFVSSNPKGVSKVAGLSLDDSISSNPAVMVGFKGVSVLVKQHASWIVYMDQNFLRIATASRPLRFFDVRLSKAQACSFDLDLKNFGSFNYAELVKAGSETKSDGKSKNSANR